MEMGLFDFLKLDPIKTEDSASTKKGVSGAAKPKSTPRSNASATSASATSVSATSVSATSASATSASATSAVKRNVSVQPPTPKKTEAEKKLDTLRANLSMCENSIAIYEKALRDNSDPGVKSNLQKKIDDEKTVRTKIETDISIIEATISTLETTKKTDEAIRKAAEEAAKESATKKEFQEKILTVFEKFSEVEIKILADLITGAADGTKTHRLFELIKDATKTS